MSTSPVDAIEIARSLNERLEPVLGLRLRGVVLYGSHARGEADAGSDIDLLVLLDCIDDFWKDVRRIRDVRATLALEAGVVISVFPVAEHAFRSSPNALLRSARDEGVRAA